MINDGLSAYYSARPAEYEVIYSKPERQPDLRELERRIPPLFAGKRVLEVACGTGYWTPFFAATAARVVATDLNPEPLAVAREKAINGDVEFHIADAFDLTGIPGMYEAAFVGFWWSHIPLQLIGQFLVSLHRKLETGAVVVLLDNRYVEGSSTPVARVDDDGNLYQVRQLADGTTHEVLKNFPGEADLRASLSGVAVDISYTALDYYWMVRYQTAAGD